MAADELVTLINGVAMNMTGLIHGLTLAASILGLAIWGVAKIIRPFAPELSSLVSGDYIRSLLLDGVIVATGSLVLRILAGLLST